MLGTWHGPVGARFLWF